jgi:hypothetical protein
MPCRACRQHREPASSGSRSARVEKQVAPGQRAAAVYGPPQAKQPSRCDGTGSSLLLQGIKAGSAFFGAVRKFTLERENFPPHSERSRMHSPRLQMIEITFYSDCTPTEQLAWPEQRVHTADKPSCGSPRSVSRVLAEICAAAYAHDAYQITPVPCSRPQRPWTPGAPCAQDAVRRHQCRFLPAAADGDGDYTCCCSSAAHRRQPWWAHRGRASFGAPVADCSSHRPPSAPHTTAQQRPTVHCRRLMRGRCRPPETRFERTRTLSNLPALLLANNDLLVVPLSCRTNLPLVRQGGGGDCFTLPSIRSKRRK